MSEIGHLESDSLLIEGGHALSGTVDISGFKHAMVLVLGAAYATDTALHLSNCPDITETCALVELLLCTGADVARSEDQIRVLFGAHAPSEFDNEVARHIHGAAYLAPGLLRSQGFVEIRADGGCQIGTTNEGARPLEHYAEVLRQFGAEADAKDGFLRAWAKEMRGCEIDLWDYTRNELTRFGNVYSGATKMAILAAVAATGTTILHRPYAKGEVRELLNYLLSIGVDISWQSDDTLRIATSGSLHPRSSHALGCDLIELFTWTLTSALMGRGAIKVHARDIVAAVGSLEQEFNILTEMGFEFEVDGNSIACSGAADLKPISVSVHHQTSIYSDSQPLIAWAATYAHGASILRDYVWPGRYSYAVGLRQLGADLDIDGHELQVRGWQPGHIPNQTVNATDLRAAAVLVLAALGVNGVTQVTGASHLERGYAGFAANLSRLGARIQPGRE